MKRDSLKASGFTLIELLVVISIIAILAGLTMPLIGFANLKAGKSRAKTEIEGMSSALETYKIDNGDYPRSSDYPRLTDMAADLLDATKDAGMLGTKNPNPLYQKASLALYIALSGDVNRDGLAGDVDTDTTSSTYGQKLKIYFDFKPGMLAPKVPAGTTRAANSITYVSDPFRNSYGYSTKYSADMKLATPPATPGGYNPTFDLWCTVDTTQTQTTPEVPPQDIWIKNW